MKADELLKESSQLSEIILKERRTLHKNPETGFDLKNTVSFV